MKIGLLACLTVICSFLASSPPAFSQPSPAIVEYCQPQTYVINDTAPVQVLYSTPLDMNARISPGYIVTQFVYERRTDHLIQRWTLDTLDMFHIPFKASNAIIWEVVPAVDQLPPPLIAYSGICPVSNG